MAKQERRFFDKGAKVWIHHYENLHNIAHWHFENELVVCQAGTAEVMLDGCFYTLHKGDCAFFCRESIHNITGAPRSRVAVAQFDDILRPVSYLKKPIFTDQYDAGIRMNELHREYQKKSPFYVEKMNTIIVSLIVDIFRGEALELGDYRTQPTIARYKQLLEMMEQHYDEFEFHKAALFMNMSEAYFSRYFKRMTGLTFSQYMNVLRTDRAIELLSQKLDINMDNLMAECGFNTLRSFNRVFKNITGYAPKQLPFGFSLNRRILLSEETLFNPTLDTSIILKE
jgi:AraC-like DNA-binding protein